MAAAATTEEATATEQLKYQTWNLKVSIHCEGCRRKVKKVLQSVEGVYMTTIDSQKQKVTVTGNVGPDTLIKKLIKTGKPAELWPEPDPKPDPKPNPNNGGSNKNKNKNKNQPKPNTESSDTQEPKEPEPEPEQKKSSEETKEPPAEGKKKKKGKKGNGDDNGSEAKEVQGHQKPPPPPLAPPPPPHQQECCNLPMYPLPQYVVSYRAMQPAMAGSYCVPGTAMAAVGSYDFFTEENASACSVM